MAQRSDGQPKRRKLLQNRRKAVSIREEFADLRRARARRKEQWAANDPDVQNYRVERQLAHLRWTIEALSMGSECQERQGAA